MGHLGVHCTVPHIPVHIRLLLILFAGGVQSGIARLHSKVHQDRLCGHVVGGVTTSLLNTRECSSTGILGSQRSPVVQVSRAFSVVHIVGVKIIKHYFSLGLKGLSLLFCT